MNIMTENNFSSDIQDLSTLAKQIKDSISENRAALVGEYLRRLNKLMNQNWLYALGKDNEIDEALLPDRYIAQRNSVVDELEIQLGECAGAYRASSSGSTQEIQNYHKVFAEMIRMTGEIIGLDPDAELPDKYMPDEYIKYWL